MTTRTPARQKRFERFCVLLMVVFFMVAGGCSGGGGGDAAIQVDTRVTIHYLDRVYDDDVQYYSVGVIAEPGEEPLTVSQTNLTNGDGEQNPYFNGLWTALDTWEFEETIPVGAETQELVFVLLKVNACAVCQDPVEGEWFSAPIILTADQTRYEIELFPEFDVMDYHIEGGVISSAATCIQGVAIELKTADGDMIGERLTSEYGFYSFGEISNGDYLVAPAAKPGCTFDPPSLLVTIDHASEMTADFQAYPE